MMRTLRLRNIGWCEAHGHPVATLGVDDDSAFIGVAISTADAQAMSVAAVAPLLHHSSDTTPENTRLYGLLDLVMTSLGGCLTAIDLTVGSDRIVRSSLRIDGPFGVCKVPAAFSDALVLSQRMAIPLRIADDSFEQLMGGHGDASKRPHTQGVDADSSSGTDRHATLDVYRSFVDGLDLDHLG